jgi:putative ABC transport system permease protein
VSTFQVLRYSFTLLRRDWRAGELRLLALALIIAVTSVTSVGFFTNRIERGMELQAAELLAGDLVISSSKPITEAYGADARALGLEAVETQAFRSMAVAGDYLQLVEVKAVSPGYPLRGTIRIADSMLGLDGPTSDIPGPGVAWVDQRVLQAFQLEVGDQLDLGNLSLKIEHVLTYEPDRGGDFFNVGPRVLINRGDVEATGLLGLGSRAEYRLLLAGDEDGVAALRQSLEGRLSPDEKVLDIREGRPEVRMALERAGSFLGLAALISVLLAGVAIAMTARRHAQRHFDTSAIMRCLGAQQNTILKLYLLELLWLALLGGVTGSLLGVVGQEALARVMDQLVLATLPAPSWEPAVIGLLTGLIAMMGFAVPPIIGLVQVPPLRVLRRDMAPRPLSKGLLYGTAATAMVLLVAWQVRDTQLLTYVVGGSVLTSVLLVLAAWSLVWLLGPLRSRVGVSWRFGLANIVRYRYDSIAQVVSLGLGILVLLLLTLVRTDLLTNWKASLPEDAPNHFLINIQSDQVEGVNTRLADMTQQALQLYPMVRARLVAVNDRPVSASDYDNPRSQRLVTREFNLSWSAAMQADNRTVAGRWWTQEEQGEPVLSIEQSMAQALGLVMGDVMTFNINGSPLSLRISHVRTVQWDSFNVNFFTLSPPGVLDRFPASWITSVHIPAQNRTELAGLIRDYPNVTVIDVDALMSRVRAIMDRVNTAVEFVFLFTLLAGIVVLYAVIQTQQDARGQHHALLRTLGANRRQIMRGLVSEFLVLGGLAGLLAAIAATALHWVLAEYVFQLSFSLNPWVGLIGILSGSLGVALFGSLGARASIDTPPVQTLRGVN